MGDTGESRDDPSTDETYTEYVRRYHEEEAWHESLREIAPIEHAQQILEDSHQVDPYGVGGLNPEDAAAFRAWIENGFSPRRKEDQ